MKKYGFSFEWEEIEDKIELPQLIDNLEKYKDSPKSLNYKSNFSHLRSFYHEYLNGNPLDMDGNIMKEIYDRYEKLYKTGV